MEEVELPLLAEAHRLWFLLCVEDFRSMLPLVDEWGDAGLRRAVANLFAVAQDWWGRDPGCRRSSRGGRAAGSLVRQLQEFLEHRPLLLTPVSAEPAVLHGADAAGVDRMRSLVAAQWPMTAVPALGFPAVAVPTGTADGLPTRRAARGSSLRRGRPARRRAGRRGAHAGADPAGLVALSPVRGSLPSAVPPVGAGNQRPGRQQAGLAPCST